MPSNPKTAGQQEKRSYLRDSVTAWQTDGLTNADVIAWNRYAKIQKKILSGYNVFLRDHMECFSLGNTWQKLTNCIVSDVSGIGFKVEIKAETDLEGILYIGPSEKAMITEFEGVFSVDKYTFTVTGLDENKNYYFYIKNTTAGEQARTGIYKQKTIVGIPLEIDIGAAAIDRTDYVASQTSIAKNNPANRTGKINSIEIWANQNLENCKVATFFVVSGNNLSTRDYQVIGTVIAGSKKTFVVDLEVQEGDYIGIYYTAGRIDRDDTGGEGAWYYGADKIPCTDFTFSSLTGKILSLYGTGTT